MVRILVAEDERDIRELIAFTLRFAGFEVELASRGRSWKKPHKSSRT